jgi:hypothetical protein
VLAHASPLPVTEHERLYQLPGGIGGVVVGPFAAVFARAGMRVSRESRTGLTSGVVNAPLMLAYLPLGLGLGLGLKPDGLTGGGCAGMVVTGVLVLGAVIVMVVACSRRSIPFGDFGTTLLIVLGALSVVLGIVLGSEHRFPTEPSARFSLSPRGIRESAIYPNVLSPEFCLATYVERNHCPRNLFIKGGSKSTPPASMTSKDVPI